MIFFFFLEVKRWFLMQSEKSETWGLKNKMPPHITTSDKTVGFGVSVARNSAALKFLCPVLPSGAGVQRSGEAPEQ